ncbi:response regulator transcription factor [Marinicrinis lubricantis]|uniref:Response regulator n=1 Tax=Marinicrinis lubricantis TaxID=2086470 RepID=A0ABW1IJC8_9BACL
MLGILLADDEPLSREGFLSIDWEREGFKPIGTSRSGKDTLRMVRRLAPQIVLTDIRMPDMDGIELARKIKEMKPNAKIILLSDRREIDYAIAAIEIGAISFLLKPSRPVEMVAACRKARNLIEAEQQKSAAQRRLERRLRVYSGVLRERLVPDGSASRCCETIAKAVAMMEGHYAEELTAARVAKQVHLNPVYFSRLFKKETGETFSNRLLQIRLGKAMELIRDRDIKIYEIAEKVGFKDGRYFGQIFKQHCGMSPRQFRRLLLESPNNWLDKEASDEQ